MATESKAMRRRRNTLAHIRLAQIVLAQRLSSASSFLPSVRRIEGGQLLQSGQVSRRSRSHSWSRYLLRARYALSEFSASAAHGARSRWRRCGLRWPWLLLPAACYVYVDTPLPAGWHASTSSYGHTCMAPMVGWACWQCYIYIFLKNMAAVPSQCAAGSGCRGIRDGWMACQQVYF
eukprot:SAG31_NODE_72_length_27821_cov_26.870572_8_plen_177_part_00